MKRKTMTVVGRITAYKYLKRKVLANYAKLSLFVVIVLNMLLSCGSNNLKATDKDGNYIALKLNFDADYDNILDELSIIRDKNLAYYIQSKMSNSGFIQKSGEFSELLLISVDECDGSSPYIYNFQYTINRETGAKIKFGLAHCFIDTIENNNSSKAAFFLKSLYYEDDSSMFLELKDMSKNYSPFSEWSIYFGEKDYNGNVRDIYYADEKLPTPNPPFNYANFTKMTRDNEPMPLLLLDSLSEKSLWELIFSSEWKSKAR